MFISLFHSPCICLLSFGLARSLARLEPLKIWFLFRFMILFIALLIITIKISLCFYRILASSLKIFTVRHDWKKPPGKVWKNPLEKSQCECAEVQISFVSLRFFKVFTVRGDWKKNPGKVWKKNPGKIRHPKMLFHKKIRNVFVHFEDRDSSEG